MSLFRACIALAALAMLAFDVVALSRCPAWARPRILSDLAGYLFFAATGFLLSRGF